MGIYDRDYYRREGPSFLGSLESGKVCMWLIGINVLSFVIQMATLAPVATSPWSEENDPGGQFRHVFTQYGPKESVFTDAFILDVPKVLHGQIWRLLTYAFLHSTSSFWHILWNMLFLWWFGRGVEDIYGPREFLAFYLISAVVAGIAYCVAYQMGIYHASALGASGAVTACLVLFACHFPRQVILIFFVLPIPVWAFVAFVVAKDTFSVLGHVNDGVAAAAHVGGAAFAFAYYRQQWRLTNLTTYFQQWRRRLSRPHLRVYREPAESRSEAVSVGAASNPPLQRRPDDEQLEAKMDAVLEKMSRVGKENLTESEMEVLRRAAELIKRRRS